MENKKLHVSIKTLSYDFIDTLSKETKYTKSEIMQKLLFNITLQFWSDPKEFIDWWNKSYGTK